MKRFGSIGCAVLFATAVGCNKKSDDATESKKPTTTAASSKKPDMAPAVSAAKKLMGDELAKAALSCIDAWNSHDAAKLGACYTDDVKVHMVDSGMPPAMGKAAALAGDQMIFKGFSDIKNAPQLVLVNGNNVAIVSLLTGTNDGEMMGKPATKKKIGVYGLLVWSLTDDGKIKEAHDMIDHATILGQLGLMPPNMPPDMAPRPVVDKGAASPEIVVAKNDAGEKTNLDAITKGDEDMQKGDFKAMMAGSTDDVVMMDQTDSADIKGKEAIQKSMDKMMKFFTNAKFENHARWAAGDYVFEAYGVQATAMNKPVKMEGANIFKFTGGKVSQIWGFGDKMGVMQQLGMVPAMAPGGAPAMSAAPAMSGAMSAAPGSKLKTAPAGSAAK